MNLFSLQRCASLENLLRGADGQTLAAHILKDGWTWSVDRATRGHFASASRRRLADQDDAIVAQPAPEQLN
jgi:hypothetical protein